MEKKRISKDKAIEIILKEMDSGSTYSHTLSVIVGKWQINERTFDRYWNEANERYSKQRNDIKEAIIEERIEAEKEAVRANVMTRIQRMELATQIALGMVTAQVGQFENTPSAGERMRALDYLSKIEGDYAPEKTDITSNGKSFDIKDIYAGSEDKEA